MRTGKQRNRKRRKTKKSLFAGWVMACLIFFMGGMTARFSNRLNTAEEKNKQQQENKGQEITSNTSAADMDSASVDDKEVNESHVLAVGKPKQRTRAEAMEELKVLGENVAAIDDIYQNSTLYPDQLLAALANNPEMADFTAGWLNTHGNEEVTLTATEQAAEFPLFLQWDSRWGYHSYGTDSVVGLSGCGPTCLSMMLYYLTGNASLTPDVIADYSMQHGYYAEGFGTSWSLMTGITDSYPVQVSELALSESTMKSVLDAGGVIICAMGPGDFTSSGHFILIYRYDENGFYVNDPNCMARSRVRWSYDILAGQIKNLWGYTR